MTENELLQAIFDKLNNMDLRLDKLEKDLTTVKVTLETETNKKINLTLDGVTGLIEKTNNYNSISEIVQENSIDIEMLKGVSKEHSIKFQNLKKAL